MEQNDKNMEQVAYGENVPKTEEATVETPGAGDAPEEKEYKEITLKFGKGCVGDAFTAKEAVI